MTWTVRRCSGRGDPAKSWRTLYEGPNETEARRVFAREGERLRQGGVRLLKDGDPVEGRWAPRNRTRW